MKKSTLELVKVYRMLRRSGRHKEAEELLKQHERNELFVSFCRFSDELLAELARILGRREQGNKS